MAFINSKYGSSIWFHLLLMVIVSVVLYVILFNSIDKITGHGKQMKIPVIIDKSFSEAVKILEKEGFEIDVDSVYDMKKAAGVVVAQMPDTGAFVKRGRTVFITVNKQEAPLTPMPDLSGVSYRSADMLLRSSKLILGDTVHRPDIADGAILEALHNGKTIEAGTMVPQGTRITLVIGDGLGNTEYDVPNVVGMTYPEGIAMLNALGLQFIDVWVGDITDSMTAVIYYQFPSSKNEFGGGNKIKAGEMVDIKIKQTYKKESPTQRNNNPSKGVNTDNDDWGG